MQTSESSQSEYSVIKAPRSRNRKLPEPSVVLHKDRTSVLTSNTLE